MSAVTTLTPSNWRTALVNATVTILAAAIALRVAADLIRSVAIELIIGFVVLVLVYGLWAFTRYQRSRW